jgi:signal transduction histidine kinase/ligand-binding sensor domain-containing protein
MRAVLILRTLLISFLVMLSCVPAFADAGDRTITQFQHTAWTAKDGAPTTIVSIAQTADGYLWLGTLSGLFRFDGVRFEQYQPRSGGNFPSNEIASLLALLDGGLWIGFMHGGASLLKDGHVTTYGEPEGIPSGRVSALVQDQAGTVWAAIYGRGLARLEDGHWTRIGANWNFPGESAQTAFVDREGSLWVATDHTVVLLPRGAKSFQPTGEHIGVVCQIAEAPDGGLWIAETSRNVRRLRFPDRHASIPEVRVGSQAVLFDETGALWATSLGDGIAWVRRPGELGPGVVRQNNQAVVMFTHKNDLTDDVVLSIFRDREDNVWVGTPKGLERFYKGNLVPVVFPPGYQKLVIAAGDNGAVWTGSQSRPITQVQGMKMTAYIDDPISCAYRAPNGEIWLGGFGKVYHVSGGEILVSRSRFKADDRSAIVMAITQDRAGRLWIALNNGDLWTIKSGLWQRYENAALPSSAVRAEYTDAQGKLWFGYGSNLVAVLDNGSVQPFSEHDGVAVGGVKVVRGRSEDVWIGGENGLAFFKRGRFQMLGADGAKPFSGISGIVETPDGSLWLSEARGVIHIPVTEIQKAFRDPAYKVQYRLFDFADGLPGAIQQVAAPTAIEGTDGRLWFATTGGLVWIDPMRIRRNLLPPSVNVLSVGANGKDYADLTSLNLGPRTTSIQIAYTALSLTVPERVRFRYKLEGFDKDWQDAGRHREAFYSNLGPGHYRFHVIACNNDGVWNESGAAMEFSISPTFYQAAWFRVLCVAALLGLLWTLYRFRLQQLHRQFNIGLEARVNERTRIARELHDTLLQSFHGLMFQFQAARNMLPRRPDEAIDVLDSAIGATEQAITEGRSAIQQLRSEQIDEGDLAQWLTSIGEELARAQQTNGDSPIFRVTVEGEQSLSPLPRTEVCRITREILQNAFRHAQAHHIEAEIRYDDRLLRVRIRDDGKGIDPQVLQAGGSKGHWGLRGARERAQQIGASLEFWSEAGAGTEVQLSVPAAVAYEKSGNKRRFRLFRKGQD